MPVSRNFVLVFVAAVFAVVGVQAESSAQTLPEGWATKDIGSVGIAGSATHSSGTFVVNGAGADVWGSADAFRFTYQTLVGDGSIVARVTGVDNIDPWTKAGVMMRETLAANSRQAFMLVSPGKGLAFQRRKSTGGSSTHTSGGSGTAPAYLKLTRAGSTIKAYKSADGSAWTQVGSDTITMASTIYVGVGVSSHVVGVNASADFSNTVVTEASAAVPPPPPPSGTAKTLRVVHWNSYHGGRRTDGVYDPTGFASWLAKFNADVISLNEVDSQSQVDAIVNALKAKTGTTWNVSYSGMGNLVISRLAMTTKSKCVYPDGKRYAAHLSTTVNGRSINVWSTHLSVSSASARLAEVKSLQTCAKDWPEARILAGDYNMQAGSAEYNAAIVNYTDAWKAAKALGTAVNYAGNCDGCTRNSRIDYVFTPTGASWLVLKSAQMFDTRNSSGVAASDHKPMLVVYEVR